jgi:DNA polymerase III alpha subunit (gram-positive type)
MPKGDISTYTSNVHGISKYSTTLMHNGKPVKSLTIVLALRDFIGCLQKLKTSNDGKIILVAHNGHQFDDRVLMFWMIYADLLTLFRSLVYGFCDSLKLFRALHPMLSCHKLEFLCEQLCSFTYDAHDASQDVLALKKLMTAQGIDTAKLLCYLQKIDCAIEQVGAFGRNESLQPLVTSKSLSKSMAKKLASAGFDKAKLEQAFQQGGSKSLSLCLSPVIKSTSVINSIISYFK